MTAALDLLSHPDVIDAELSKRKLRHFMKAAWHVIEPGHPFIGGWHIDAECDHIEAVLNGEIRLLAINVPPRFTKSTVLSVMAPVWSWLNEPSLQWLTMSYSAPLAIRDAVKSRRLLQSGWFEAMQGYWGTNIHLESDQNQKARYENNHSGYRMAVSLGGSATGEGGDNIVIDDPHNVKDGESDAIRKETLTTFREVIPSRLNNQKTGAIIVIMQRVHFNDCTNEALTEMGYEHLNLAMEYDPKCIVDYGHKCSLRVEFKNADGEDSVHDSGTSIGFKDPRTVAGDYLCRKRFGDAEIARLKRQLSDYAWFSQYQQQPTPREGGMFKEEYFQVVDVLPSPVKRKRHWRAWDKAGTKDGGARTVGVEMAEMENGRLIVLDVKKGQWEAPERESHIKSTAIGDTKDTKVSIEQEPGSGGKESAQATVRNLRGFKVYTDKVTGSKELRAEPWATSCANGDVYVLRRDWTRDFIKEHAQFPRGKFKDQVDASSQAFSRIAEKTQFQIG